MEREREATKMGTTGRFVWREALTTDTVATCTFYKALFGWTLKPVDMGGMTYTLIHLGEKQIGGIMTLPPNAKGAPSSWMSYCSVDDVDAAAVRAVEAGGKLFMAPHDIPDIGRFAMLQDPLGALVTVWKSKGEDGADAPPAVGEFCWEQLVTTSTDDAKDFYGKVFGWKTKVFAGEASTTIFTASGLDVASMMGQEGAPSHWVTYVRVASLADANAKVKELGGKLMMENIPVPGMGALSILQDPTGAVLGLFEGNM